MKIKHPVIIVENDVAKLNYDVEFLGQQTHLWYQVSKEHAEFLSDSCDAALLALLLPAMQAKEDIFVEGQVSETLYHNVITVLQDIFIVLIPSLTKINIHATIFSESHLPANGVASGFSAGIDSFCTLADYHYSQHLTSFRLTHLLYNNVGSHGGYGQNLFFQRLSHIQAQIKSLGLPLIWVNSNLDDFYTKAPGLGFAQTHTIRNASVPHALQKGIGKFFYSSAFPIHHTVVKKAKDTAYIDPVILPLMSSDTLHAFSIGGEYTRVEKTLKVARLEASYNALDVCTKPHNEKQCSKCKKCLRTLLTLDIAGLLHHYNKRFDFSVYNKKKILHIAQILTRQDPLAKEIRAFMKEKNFKIPLLSKIYSFMPFIK